MDISVFIAVIGAALLHASWNSVLKNSADRFSTVMMVTLVQAGIALVLLPFFEVLDTASWTWIGVSAVLHVGYMVFLSQAYTHSDLSFAYPIARGSAPLLVALASVVVFAASFSTVQMVAILTISGGILALTLRDRAKVHANGKALFFAFGTAGFIASYTLVDGLGVRAAGSAPSYILWLSLFEGLGMVSFALLRRGLIGFPLWQGRLAHSPSILTVLQRHWRAGLIAGTMSLASYWIAVWAFLHAPIALVAALRETSIFFAVVIAAFALREPVHRVRWISAAAIVVGAGLMKI